MLTAMRDALTAAEKEHIYTRKQDGLQLRVIANELGCSLWTARKWWRYRRDKKEPRPRGRSAHGVLSSYPDGIREAAIAFKQAHPHQGPDKVRLEVKRQLELDETALPSASRLAVLFREQCPEAVKTYRRNQYPEETPRKATYPHQLWQVDGKEKVPIGEQDLATVLDIRDSYSGLMILSDVFLTTTDKGWRKLTLNEVRGVLRQAFYRWGRPCIVQTDREVVYIGAPERYFPSAFTLWLVGLGIEHRVIRSRRPTDQGEVERQHRTLGDWLWKDTHFDTLEALRAALVETNQTYNEEYPARTVHCHRTPPLIAHPNASQSGRPFHPSLEWELFDMAGVDAFLAQQVWNRTASETGMVSVGGHPYYLGRPNGGQKVSVTFQPEGRTLRFETRDGECIAERLAVGLDKPDLIGQFPSDGSWPKLTESFQLPLQLQGV